MRGELSTRRFVTWLSFPAVVTSSQVKVAAILCTIGQGPFHGI